MYVYDCYYENNNTFILFNEWVNYFECASKSCVLHVQEGGAKPGVRPIDNKVYCC